MELGYVSVRMIEKLCETDIRFMWLLQDEKAPSFMTINIYIDGTKITANANKYSWVWKKSSIKYRQNVFKKITALLEEINNTLMYQGIKFGIRTEYAIEYMEEITEQYVKLTEIKPEVIFRGRGHRKTVEQRNYDKLMEYTEKLKKYAKHIRCIRHNQMEQSVHKGEKKRHKRRYFGNCIDFLRFQPAQIPFEEIGSLYSLLKKQKSFQHLFYVCRQFGCWFIC